MLFGLLMALTLHRRGVGGRVRTRGDPTMFIAALGCNLAWGLGRRGHVPGSHRHRSRPARSRSFARCSGAPTRRPGRAVVEQSLSRVAAGLVSPTEVEAIRGRIVAMRIAAGAAAPLERNDLLAAFAIFLIVVASTFPVVAAVRCSMQDVGAGAERVACDRAGDAVPRRARARALCRLRQLAASACSWRRSATALVRRDQRARRMKAARWAVAALGAALAATTVMRRGGQRARRAALPDEAVVGVRAHRLSDRRSRRRQTTPRRSRSPIAARCTSRPDTTTSRSAHARRSSAGPSPAAKRSPGS